MLPEHYRAAGVLPFARRPDDVYLLLGQEDKRELMWSCFGGKREGREDDPVVTAVREFIEETGGQTFMDSGEQFRKVLSTSTSRGPVMWSKDALYLLYCLEIPFTHLEATWALSTHPSTSATLTTTRPHDAWTEKCGFAWVSFAGLRTLIETKQPASFELHEGLEQRGTISRLSGYLHALLSSPNTLQCLARYFGQL